MMKIEKELSTAFHSESSKLNDELFKVMIDSVERNSPAYDAVNIHSFIYSFIHLIRV